MYKISEIAAWIQAKVANPEFAKLDPATDIQGMKSLKEAGPGDLAFFFSKHYQDELVMTRASLIITGHAFVEPLKASGLPQWKTATFLSCESPNTALALVSAQFSKLQSTHDHQVQPTISEIHATAIIHPTAQVADPVQIGPGVVIEKNVSVGRGVVIYPNCYLGPGASIGEGSVLFPGVTLYEKTKIGKNVRIHAGAVIGADGFGYTQVMDATTKKPVDHLKIYHLGRVVIEDGVEVGANTTIDRGTMGDTVIRKNAKIDNQVQVGHNCEVGEGAILCGASGMAGSSSLGKFVMLGAKAGPGNQVHVGDYSKLAGYTGAAKDVPPDTEMCGMPARPMRDFFKLVAIQNKMLKDREKDRG